MDLTRVLESPHALHAASVHLPLSLGLLGLPLVFAALLAPKRWPGARRFAGPFFLFMTLVALAGVFTGERAASELVALASKEIETVVAQHRLLGFSVAALSFLASILFMVDRYRARPGGGILGGLAALNVLALAMAAVYAGASGGRLVYGFGIGTPIAGADGMSGATPIVGAYFAATPADFFSAAPATEESFDTLYTPNTRPIDSTQAASITFERDVLPLLERHCFQCHRGEDPAAGLDLTTYASILEGGAYAGASVIPGDPDASPMVRHIRGIYLPKMPKDAAELTEDELHIIRMWIASGAKGE